MKIVFLDASTVGDSSLESISALGELVCFSTSTPQQALERVGDCDVLIVNKVRVTEELVAAAPKLKLVCEAATGVNNIDKAALDKRGIPLKNVAGYSTDFVAQTTFMHILSLLGNAPYYDGAVKDGSYSRGPIFTDLTMSMTEAAGKTMGIIGMGAIGSRVASIAEAFGMRVIYYSTSGTSHCIAYPSVSLEELMKTSDVISIHAPLNGRTSGLVGENELRLMKRDAIIVNMGRGGIVDEAALARVIDEGVIGGAAMDVYSVEPLPSDHPLLHTSHPEKLRFSPHVGWASKEARGRLISAIAQNIKSIQ